MQKIRTIHIGKEGNQPFKITAPTVSRHHAELDIYDNGEMILRDKLSTNGTFIKMRNGDFRRLQEMKVSKGNTVRFGPTLVCNIAQLLSSAANTAIVSPQPKQPHPTEQQLVKEIDITALRYLVDHYNDNILKIEQKSSSTQNMRMLIPMISMLVAGLVGLLSVNTINIGDNELLSRVIKVLPSVAVLILAAILWTYINRTSRELIRKKKALDHNFRRNYCCPMCHYPFGNTLYEHLIAQGRCPKCKSKFYEKV